MKTVRNQYIGKDGYTYNTVQDLTLSDTQWRNANFRFKGPFGERATFQKIQQDKRNLFIEQTMIEKNYDFLYDLKKI